MGWLHYEIGDLDSALRWDLRARDAAGYQSDARAGEAMRYTLLNLATDELAAGRLQQAEGYLAEFERMLDDIEYARFRYLNRYQLVRAEDALAQGDLNAASGWAQEAAALATAKGMRKNLVKSQLLIGRTLLVLGRSREAVELLHTVVDLADALEHRSLRWQARWWLGQACAAQRQLPTARDHYRHALAQVQAIAAELEDERLRTCFLRSPLVENLRAAMAATEDRAAERAARQGDAASFPAGLTAREVEVLRLVVQGATNGAIAAVAPPERQDGRGAHDQHPWQDGVCESSRRCGLRPAAWSGLAPWLVSGRSTACTHQIPVMARDRAYWAGDDDFQLRGPQGVPTLTLGKSPTAPF